MKKKQQKKPSKELMLQNSKYLDYIHCYFSGFILSLEEDIDFMLAFGMVQLR